MCLRGTKRRGKLFINTLVAHREIQNVSARGPVSPANPFTLLDFATWKWSRERDKKKG